MGKKLAAYFSASGVTAGVAKRPAEAVGADLYEIKPKTPYTPADLNWNDKNSRSSVEMRDKGSRPEIADKNAGLEHYDTLFPGVRRIRCRGRVWSPSARRCSPCPTPTPSPSSVGRTCRSRAPP